MAIQRLYDGLRAKTLSFFAIAEVQSPMNDPTLYNNSFVRIVAAHASRSVCKYGL